MTDTNLLTPPHYCEYANGPCDQEMPSSRQKTVFFAYPSQPSHIAETIETAANNLEGSDRTRRFRTWKLLATAGQTIFCAICKEMRSSEAVIADVTTLNFNLLFEIGYAIGLEQPIVPIRDTSYELDHATFAEIGLLDTLGYESFENSDDLTDRITSSLGELAPLVKSSGNRFHDTPLYVVKTPVNTDGSLTLMSTIKKSGLRFRTYDPAETPRLSLREAYRQVFGSAGVVAHMTSPNRKGARAHNGICALVGGMAMARSIPVLLLQEEDVYQPIDYRDVVKTYGRSSDIPALVAPLFRVTMVELQTTRQDHFPKGSRGLLEGLDVGDLAAENEIAGLEQYFVPTAKGRQAKRGRARLIVGRKGTGKTALFYQVRSSAIRARSELVLDLKPEGHQFTRLRETLLDELSVGLQEHTLVALWTYILECELARQILTEWSRVKHDPEARQLYDAVEEAYGPHNPSSGFEVDFAQRLMIEIERLGAEAKRLLDGSTASPKITEAIYRGDVRSLGEAVRGYLESKDVVWLLLDNLDKSWPVMEVDGTHILVLRSLLEATRKLQRNLERQGIDFRCLVFLRTDVWDLLQRHTPDKGKDTHLSLDDSDDELLREIARRRIIVSLDIDDQSKFEDVWHQVADSHVGAQESFSYMLDRTLKRPRDLLLYFTKAVSTAIDRGHTRVMEDDFMQAEGEYSEELLYNTSFEIGDTYPDYVDVLYAFQSSSAELELDEAHFLLEEIGVAADDEEKVLDLLLWFGFLGVTSARLGEAKYSYDVLFNLRRLRSEIDVGGRFVVHPAFRAALDVGD